MPGEKLIQTANIWLSCTNYVISAGLLWWIGLVQRRGLKTVKISASVEKKWKLKYGIVASAFKLDGEILSNVMGLNYPIR